MRQYLYKKAMVVDDSKLDHFISTVLMKKNHFAEDILSFTQGPQALSYLQSLSDPSSLPEVIFLDIHMPVMDGFSFLDHYEQLPSTIQDHCTIIMVSSSESQEDFARIRTYSSIRKFFSKPLSDAILNDIRKNVSHKGDLKRGHLVTT